MRARPLVLASLLVGMMWTAPASGAPRSVPTVVTSARSGAWSDPATWAGGVVPGPNAPALIRAGDRVVLDRDARVSGLTIAGDLAFASDRSVLLASDRNVIVTGALHMRPASPAQLHDIRFVDVDDAKFVGNGNVPLDTDVGLWVTGAGRLDLAGSPKTSWTNLAGALAKGQSSGIALQTVPTGWQPGDDVFIAPTEPPTAAVGKANWLGFEQTKIAGVQQQSISTTSRAVRDHPVVDGRWTAEIGNLTRNVRIEGTPRGYSHIFISSAASQQIHNVEIRYMGVGNVIGRYPLHFHHAGDGSNGSEIDGVVVRNSGKHAFVPHASNGIYIHDTVAYDIADDAYWWDADGAHAKGNGTSGVSIDHAIAAYVHGPSGTGLTGFRLGEGGEFTNTLTRSVATGIEGYTESAGFAWKLGTSAWTFDGNIAHNNKLMGINVWQNDTRSHEITNFVAYYNDTGIRHGAYKNRYHYRDVTLYGNRTNGVALVATASAGNISFEQLRVDGAGITNVGVLACCHQVDGTAYASVIDGCTMTGMRQSDISIGASADRKRANSLQVRNCDLAGRDFYVQPGAPAASSIDIADQSGQYLLTPSAASGGSTFIADWNAYRTDGMAAPQRSRR